MWCGCGPEWNGNLCVGVVVREGESLGVDMGPISIGCVCG